MASNNNYVPSHQVGKTLENGKYELTQILGAGTFGEVWRATQVILGTTVAIKILHWRITKKDTRERFILEAKVAISLGKHPNIVAGRDLIVENNLIAIVMEYIDGGMTLESFLDEWLPSEREALRITASILRGLSYAHENGVLHRDLKPANVLLNPITNPPTPMLADFGLAGTSNGGENDGERRTVAGMRMGTPGYIAYEQWVNPLIGTARSDLYAIGVILAEMMGVEPIASDPSCIEDSIKPALRQRWLNKIASHRIRDIVARATEIEFIEGEVVQKRYPSARAMLKVVEQAMEEISVAGPPAIKRRASQTLIEGPPSVMSEPVAELKYGTHINEDEVFEVKAPSKDTFVIPAENKWPVRIGLTMGLLSLLGVIIGSIVLWPKEAPLPKAPATPEPITEAPSYSPMAGGESEPKAPATPEPIAKKAPVVQKTTATSAPIKKTLVPITPVPITPVPITPDPSVGFKNGDTIPIKVSMMLTKEAIVQSTTLRYRGASGGAWQSKPVSIDNGKIETSIVATAAFGESVSYYVDVRTVDDPGTAIKSPTQTVQITQ